MAIDTAKKRFRMMNTVISQSFPLPLSPPDNLTSAGDRGHGMSLYFPGLLVEVDVTTSGVFRVVSSQDLTSTGLFKVLSATDLTATGAFNLLSTFDLTSTGTFALQHAVDTTASGLFKVVVAADVTASGSFHIVGGTVVVDLTTRGRFVIFNIQTEIYDIRRKLDILWRDARG